MDIAKKQIIGTSIPTAKDYVQDGLIAMWDGIENTGFAADGFEHDSGSIIWKDLSNNGHDAVLTEFGRWAQNALICDGAHLAATGDRFDSIRPFDCVIEAVFSIDDYTKTGWAFDCGRNGYRVRIQSNGEKRYIAGNYYRTSVYVTDNGIHMVSLQSPENADATGEGLVHLHNGTEENDTRYNVASATGAQIMVFGGRGTLVGDNFLPCKINSIRIYDALDMERRKANYEIDKERFGI